MHGLHGCDYIYIEGALMTTITYATQPTQLEPIQTFVSTPFHDLLLVVQT